MHISETTSARTLNEALNKTLGTRNVTYADAWPMDIHNGAEYMNKFYAAVGRKYAEEVLDHRATEPCVMSTAHAHSDMTDRQRAALSHLAETTSSEQFTSSLRACVKNGALPSTSLLLLQPQLFVPEPTKVAASDDTKLALPEQLGEDNMSTPMVVDEVAPSPAKLSVNSPGARSSTQLQVNSPGASSRTVVLQSKPKRRKTTNK